MLQLLAFTDLVQRFAAQARATASVAIDFTVGSFFRAVAEANAAIALWLQWLILQVLLQTRLATSTGIAADSFVNDFGMYRMPATAGYGHATLSRYSATQSAFISVGALAKTADGTQTMAVSPDPTNPAWNGSSGFTIAAGVSSITLLMTASTPGAASNIQAGTLTALASAIAGVDTITNAAPFVGGADAESDAAMRLRFALFVDSRSRGTLSAVQYAVTSYQSGMSCFVAPNTATDNTTRYGFFTVWVDDGSGYPPTALLTNIYNAVDLVRPVGTSFVVQPPTVITASISMTITVATGYVKNNVIGPVATAIVAAVNAVALGAPLPYSQLAAIAYGVPGVINAQSVLLNGGQSDLGGNPSQVVRTSLTNVSVS